MTATGNPLKPPNPGTSWARRPPAAPAVRSSDYAPYSEIGRHAVPSTDQSPRPAASRRLLARRRGPRRLLDPREPRARRHAPRSLAAGRHPTCQATGPNSFSRNGVRSSNDWASWLRWRLHCRSRCSTPPSKPRVHHPRVHRPHGHHPRVHRTRVRSTREPPVHACACLPVEACLYPGRRTAR